MTAPLVTYAVDGRVGIVSLNRPEKLNAINAELKRALVEHFTEADRAPATSVVVLRGEGRSFCAGYDIAPNPARAARRGNALAWHESLSDDVALELTPDRLRPGPLSRRRLRVGDDVRPHDRCRRCRVRRARDPLLQGRPRPRHAVRHRSQARPRAALPRRQHRRADGALVRDSEPRVSAGRAPG